jgi:carbonic anhydrase/acetyltransferase-like protein (isoleucine patch superfamily)
MKPTAYRWRRAVRVEALGDAAPDALLGNRPLAQRQRESFAAAGFAVKDVASPDEVPAEDSLLFVDNLYVSPRLLRTFVAEAGRRPARDGPLQLALVEGPFTSFTGFAGEQPPVVSGGRRGFAYGLYACRAGASGRVDVARAEPVLIDAGQRQFTLPFSSRIPTMSDLHLPVTDQVAFELTSWVHLWMANLFFIYVDFRGRLRSPRAWPGLAGRMAAAALTAFTLRPFGLALAAARALVVRGRGCRIHPTAVVEACLLGRDVDIGPHCVVRGSILGDGVRVLEHAIVDGSVLGERVLVNGQGLVKLSLVFPEAVLTWAQASVVGRRAYLGAFARALDMRLEGDVRVRHRGVLLGTGLPFLGCCIGHRAIVSGDSLIAPGRVIPNDCRIVSDEARQIRDVSDELPRDGLLVERAGIVEPLRPAVTANQGRPAGGARGPGAAGTGGAPPD